MRSISMLTILTLAVLLGACGGGKPADTAAASPASAAHACEAAATASATSALDPDGSDDADAGPAAHDTVLASCTEDAWSPASIDCFATSEDRAQWAACYRDLTEAQQKSYDAREDDRRAAGAS